MITTKDLHKRYGRLVALDSLTMNVLEGDIYGFIGPNGAGKSTTFKVLSTILVPDRGSAEVAGVPVSRGGRVRGLIGYMPDTFGVYEDMSVYQYLDFFAAAYYIPARDRRKLVNDILDLTDLNFKRDAMVQSLSRGMQQRLGVARVLVHDPKVLILDEPASGLDPRARIEFRELLKELAAMGKTILISSHILAELSEICTRVGIIEQGRLIFEGTREQLTEKLLGLGRIRIETTPEHREHLLGLLRGESLAKAVEAREDGGVDLALADDAPPLEELAAKLVGAGIPLRRFQPEELNLEQAFMHLTGPMGADRESSKEAS